MPTHRQTGRPGSKGRRLAAYTNRQLHFDCFSANPYETAFALQSSAPELTDLTSESAATLQMYGCDPHQPSFGRDCLLARRMVERGVRIVQIHIGDWDHHTDIAVSHPNQCRGIDQACAALVKDLRQRGLLDKTLVIWGGEFGRTPVAQPKQGLSGVERDHHISAFTMWMAGGGLKPGSVGQTDEFGCYPIEDPIETHDLHATILYLLGLDHTRLTHRYQGRDFRLTDVYGSVVEKMLASWPVLHYCTSRQRHSGRSPL